MGCGSSVAQQPAENPVPETKPVTVEELFRTSSWLSSEKESVFQRLNHGMLVTVLGSIPLDLSRTALICNRWRRAVKKVPRQLKRMDRLQLQSARRFLKSGSVLRFVGSLTLGDEGAALLATVITRNSPTELRMHGCNNSSITDVNLTRVNIGVEGVRALAAVLAGSSVTHLNLEGNHIGDGGVSAVAEGLSSSPITNLNLACNSVGAEGVKALAAVLAGSNITHLNLEGNLIGDDGAAALAAVLAGSSITYLNLSSDNSIGAAGKAALDAVLAGSSVNLVLDHLRRQLTGDPMVMAPAVPEQYN